MNVEVDEEGNLKTEAMDVGGIMGVIVSICRYILMAALYGGFLTICYGAFVMKGPKEIWGEEGAPPVSPAVACTMNLATQFFIVYLGVALIKTTIELGGASPFLVKMQGLFTLAKFTVNFAPMLCILFIGARMRALQMDPKHGNPQKWAQNCFYMCAYSVMIQTILVIVMPFVVECECKQGASEGDVVFEMENQTVAMIIVCVRWVCLLCLYGGFCAVIYSVFVIEHPTDVSLTPPISPAMSCVMNLTVQYFTIYLLLWICITCQQIFGDAPVWDKAIAIFDAGRATVMFAPMLSMLFIGTRMRALQLTKATDGTIPVTAGPQTWVQDGMYLATWSVLVQLIMAILVPICTGTGKPEMDHSGNVKTPEGSHPYVCYAIETVRYFCLLAMYGGIVTVMVGVYLMTPETLPPYSNEGSLVPEQEVGGVKVGGNVPKPVAPPTKAEMSS